MLVLTRKRLEQIRIGADVRITIVKLDRNQVRLGIEAPTDVTVLRAELLRPDGGLIAGTTDRMQDPDADDSDD